MNPNTRRTQQTLYMLRRQYGDSVTVYQMVSSTSDSMTGQRQEVANAYDVRRAVVLPGTWKLEQIRGISIISANKSLVQGGEFEAGVQIFIIDARDIPFTPTTDDWLVYKDRRYDFASIAHYEDDSSWLIGTKALPGRAPRQIFNRRSESLLSLTQEVNGGS